MTPPNVPDDAVALVVGHDQQHVGRALGRHDVRRPTRFGVFGAEVDRRRRTVPAGLGRYLPSMVVVAPGVPTTPVTCCAATMAPARVPTISASATCRVLTRRRASGPDFSTKLNPSYFFAGLPAAHAGAGEQITCSTWTALLEVGRGKYQRRESKLPIIGHKPLFARLLHHLF